MAKRLRGSCLKATPYVLVLTVEVVDHSLRKEKSGKTTPLWRVTARFQR